MPNFYHHVSAEQIMGLTSSVPRVYEQHPGRIRHLHARTNQVPALETPPVLSTDTSAAPMRCDQGSCNPSAHPSGPQLLSRHREDFKEKGGNQFLWVATHRIKERTGIYGAKNFPVRVCKTDAHFQKETMRFWVF